jgi:26S proteasome regulatory subunit T5
MAPVTDEYSFEELARSTEDMNGAQLKAVCVEAGMVSVMEFVQRASADSVQLALRQNATVLTHEHFHG